MKQETASREAGTAPPPQDFLGLRQAIARAQPGTRVVVDFDETLWLRNSTEEYLRSLRPHVLAVLILALLDLLRPWLLMKGPNKRRVHRDWVRVAVASVLLPWSLPIWRRRAPLLAAAFRNEPLLVTLRSRPDLDVRIATLGFDKLVAPLLEHIAPEAPLCVCDRLWSTRRIRQIGKRAAVEAALTADGLCRAIVITDSAEDEPLLAACGQPYLIRWPEARFVGAFAHSYCPFAYTERGKRKGQRYLLQHVVLEDALLLCLAAAWLMPQPLLGALSLVVLHLCFWMIYEIGYAENDVVATKAEAKPNLPPHAAQEARRMHAGMAWFTALAASVPALLLLVYANGPSLPFLTGAEDFWTAFAFAGLIWVGYLLCARGAYWVYNRVDVGLRSFLYPVLQIFRTIGYGVLVPMNVVGVNLLLALVLARWLPYLTYRHLGKHWPGPGRLLMLALLAVLSFGGVVLALWEFVSLQFAVIIGWLTVRAHRPLRRLVAGARLAG